MSQPHLVIDNVSKRWGDFCALDQVSAAVEEGEFFVLLGPSGCGKSTLLRMIAGLDTLSEGALTLDGAQIDQVHPRERNIAMIFQNYALYPHMSVRRNIAYPLHVAGLSKDIQQVEVEKIARLLDLEGCLEKRPAQLSGGQRQRVAMGRALVRKPHLFLMDEPLSNLDARLRQQMRIEIRRLQQSMGITTLYVTHDQIEAMTMADRIMILNGGKVEQVGTPDDIYHRPASLFVAAFVGSPPMNFILDPALIQATGHQSENRVAAIRPEQLCLADDAQGDNHKIQVMCAATESLGSETLLHLHVQGDTCASTNPQQLDSTQQTITARWSGDHRERHGTAFALAVPLSKVLIYRRSDGILCPAGS